MRRATVGVAWSVAAIALTVALILTGLGLCLWGLYQALHLVGGPIAAALGTGFAALLIASVSGLIAVRTKERR